MKALKALKARVVAVVGSGSGGKYKVQKEKERTAVD